MQPHDFHTVTVDDKEIGSDVFALTVALPETFAYGRPWVARNYTQPGLHGGCMAGRLCHLVSTVKHVALFSVLIS